jgi:hypothetical protein
MSDVRVDMNVSSMTSGPAISVTLAARAVGGRGQRRRPSPGRMDDQSAMPDSITTPNRSWQPKQVNKTLAKTSPR